MIGYNQVVQQIRTVRGDVFKTVAGAASVESLDFNVNPALPAAFVVPIAFEAEPNAVRGGALKQECTETFGVVVIAPSGDQRAQTGANTIPALRIALMSALLNWQVDSDYALQGIQYHEDHLIHADTGRVFWLFTFRLAIQISHNDGFKPVYPALKDIKISTPTTTQFADVSGLDAPFAP